jgi:hypothetical protein
MILVGKPEGRRPTWIPSHNWEEDNVRWILEEWDGVACTGFIWLKIGTSSGSCEHGNETSGSITCWDISEVSD